MKEILVIQEADTVIGVASTVENSLQMIQEYFGENSEIISKRHIEDSGLEYVCEVFVREDDGYTYPIRVYYFAIDKL